MPKVSVILPTYNRAHLLGRAIRSVLDQTYQDFELIVIDDGSTDNTNEVVKSFNEPRIRYIRQELNRGPTVARNIGINAAKGKYIAFQDSDDEWLPEKLKKQMSIFEISPERIGVVYTGFYSIKCGRKKYIPDKKVKIFEGDIYQELLKKNFVGTPAAIVRKSCFERVGMFNENLPCLEDWELFIRISKYYNFRFIDEPLLNAFFSPGSISTNREAPLKAHMLILFENISTLEKNRYSLANMHYLVGNQLCQGGNMCEGRGYLIRALRTNPLNIKYMLAAFSSLLGRGAYANICRLKRIICSND